MEKKKRIYSKRDIKIGLISGIIITLFGAGIFYLVRNQTLQKPAQVVTQKENQKKPEEDKSDEGTDLEKDIKTEETNTVNLSSYNLSDKQEKSKETDDPKNETLHKAEIPEWNKSTIYLKGDKVIYKGKIFQAKWWTQGEIPGSDEWGAWKGLGKAETEDSNKIVEEENKSIKEPEEEVFQTSENNAFKVVAYYPSWKTNALEKVRFDIVTHVIYAFGIPTAEGGLRPLENPETAKELIKLAHKNKRKVLLAIGGWSYNDVPLESTFKEATSTDKKLQKFGDAILAACDEYGFDGIDMDWEHPRVDDSSKDQYEKLMVYLSKKLHKKGKLLTSAVLSGATPDGSIYYDAAAHSDKVIEVVDWLNVMAYDGGDGERHSSYSFAVNCAKYWKNTRKVPSEKVVLGVPFYGRPSWASYEDLLAANPDTYKGDITNMYGMEAYYNGPSTIKKKTAYALKHLGGVMIWEITQDTTNKKKSLLTAIGETIQPK